MSHSEEDQSSASEASEGVTIKISSKKRNAEQAELEVDLNAPEPPSKKALRKAKRAKPDSKSSKNPADGTKTSAPSKESDNAVKRSDYGIWIGNLSFTTTKEELLDFITGDTDHVIDKDQVTRIHLPSGPMKFGKPQNKGFAYIDFTDSKILDKALELSEKLLGGRRVLIKNAKSFEGRPADAGKNSQANDKGHPPSKRLFVGNLAFDTSVEDLEAHFSSCGTVLNTHMATFEDTGKCKGYAWVEFEQLPSAQAAMRGWVEEGKIPGTTAASVKKSDRRIWLHKLQGRKLRLEYAEDKTVRYQKRFGKDAVKQTGEQPAIEEVAGDDDVKTDKPKDQTKSSQGRDHREKRRKVREGGYAESTVRRLTGAIVEAQGSKVTFD